MPLFLRGSPERKPNSHLSRRSLVAPTATSAARRAASCELGFQRLGGWSSDDQTKGLATGSGEYGSGFVITEFHFLTMRFTFMHIHTLFVQNSVGKYIFI